MSNQLGPIDVCCDAPPYAIVRACEMLGFQSPLDVRWCRMSHYPYLSGEQDALHNGGAWRWFTNKGPGKEKTCTCGESLPMLEGYTFTLACEKVLEYRLGQCGRCRTIFWEEE